MRPHAIADARFCFPLPEEGDAAALAPLLCAGLIGWRSYRMAGEGAALGIYGFGAAAHILCQVAVWQGRRVYAFTRGGDTAAQDFARSLGAVWAGGSDETPPEPLDAAIIFAPVGALVPRGAARGEEGRTRGVRRHPHVGHPELSLPHPVGGAAGRVGRQPDARRRARVSGGRAEGRRQDRGGALSARSRRTRRSPI